MPVAVTQLAQRPGGLIGVGIFDVTLFTVPVNTRTEIKELITSGRGGDANNHFFQFNSAGDDIDISVLAVNSTFEILVRQTLLPAGAIVQISADVANSNIGDNEISGVEYT